jgi:hypothetical protein
MSTESSAELSPHERMERIANLLAVGVMRVLEKRPTNSLASAKTCLDVIPDPRLSVSQPDGQ